MVWRPSLLSYIVACLLASPAQATVHIVAPEGSGDWPTLQEAVHAATNGDTIQLLSGTFTGPGNREVRLLGKAIIIESSSGDPVTCIIDCESAGVGFLIVDGEGRDTVIRNLTITRGQSERAGGVFIVRSAPTIEGMHFVANVATFGLGAGGVYSHESNAVVRDCYFEGNLSAAGAGAIWSREDVAIEVSRCDFVVNRSTSTIVSSAAISIEQGEGTITDCLFWDNAADNGPVLGVAFDASCRVSGCTFVGNGGRWTTEASGSALTIENSIVAFNDGSFVECFMGGQVLISCTAAFGNTRGDWIGCAQEFLGKDGNFAADPLFCDADADWTLRSDSPCAPENGEGCGLIGRYPVGCDVVPVVQESWGELKHRFLNP